MKRIFLILAMALSGVCTAQDKKADSDSMPRAGLNGVSSPICIHCPHPKYSGEARKAKLEGTVLLDVTVTTDGEVLNPIVIKAPADVLADLAVKQVKKWKMRPANDASGKPVNCRVQVEVTFHLN